jgi:aspartate ammonia-lyase
MPGHDPADAAFTASLRTGPAPGAPARTEHDSLGALPVPADAYWGIHTARALENFQLSGRAIGEYPDLICAYAQVKRAAARANAAIGALPAERAELIDRAGAEVAAGALMDQFVVDLLQGGAGTSTNMNVNEVLANRGLELAGHPRGAYEHLSPLDDVNRSQSTNDTYPTALKLALHRALSRLARELGQLEAVLSERAEAFDGVVKVGRTQLQDAVPMTLRQEFEAFALTIAEERAALLGELPALCEVSLGATAVGTGIAAPRGYREAVRDALAEATGLEIRTAGHLVKATTDVGAYLDVSGALKRLAMRLSKLCNDLRLLSSGPQFGFGEIALPPRQAGSSIMPGKVNPVVPEAVNQVAFVVAGADVTVAMACEAGQLQLNAFGPVVTFALLGSLKYLTAASRTLREHCIAGIEPDRARLEQQVQSFVGVITSFTPYIGYEAAAELAQEALATRRPIEELLAGSGLMDPADVRTLLDPRRLAGEDESDPPLAGEHARAPAPRE